MCPSILTGNRLLINEEKKVSGDIELDICVSAEGIDFSSLIFSLVRQFRVSYTS